MTQDGHTTGTAPQQSPARGRATQHAQGTPTATRTPADPWGTATSQAARHTLQAPSPQPHPLQTSSPAAAERCGVTATHVCPCFPPSHTAPRHPTPPPGCLGRTGGATPTTKPLLSCSSPCLGGDVSALCPRGGRAGPQRPLSRCAHPRITHGTLIHHVHASPYARPCSPPCRGAPNPLRAAPSRPPSRINPRLGSPTGGLRCAQGLGEAGRAGSRCCSSSRREEAARRSPATCRDGWGLAADGRGKQSRKSRVIPCCCLLPDLGQPCASLSPAWCCSHPGRGGGRMARTWGGKNHPQRLQKEALTSPGYCRGSREGRHRIPSAFLLALPASPCTALQRRASSILLPKEAGRKKRGARDPRGTHTPWGHPACPCTQPAVFPARTRPD